LLAGCALIATGPLRSDRTTGRPRGHSKLPDWNGRTSERGQVRRPSVLWWAQFWRRHAPWPAALWRRSVASRPLNAGGAAPLRESRRRCCAALGSGKRQLVSVCGAAISVDTSAEHGRNWRSRRRNPLLDLVDKAIACAAMNLAARSEQAV